LKPENVYRRRSVNSRPCPETGRRNCYFVRSLELNSNDFSRLARSTFCQRSDSKSALGGRFRLRTTQILRFEPSSSKPFNHTTQFSVLSTRLWGALALNPPWRRANARHAAPVGLLA